MKRTPKRRTPSHRTAPAEGLGASVAPLEVLKRAVSLLERQLATLEKRNRPEDAAQVANITRALSAGVAEVRKSEAWAEKHAEMTEDETEVGIKELVSGWPRARRAEFAAWVRDNIADVEAAASKEN